LLACRAGTAAGSDAARGFIQIDAFCRKHGERGGKTEASFRLNEPWPAGGAGRGLPRQPSYHRLAGTHTCLACRAKPHNAGMPDGLTWPLDTTAGKCPSSRRRDCCCCCALSRRGPWAECGPCPWSAAACAPAGSRWTPGDGEKGGRGAGVGMLGGALHAKRMGRGTGGEQGLLTPTAVSAEV